MPCQSAQMRPADELNHPLPKWSSATETAGLARVEGNKRTIFPSSANLAKAAVISPVIPTPRKSVNKERSKKSQRECFIQHLRDWASNHDSSVYFHGTINLYPPDTFPGEVLELGKSVNCILDNSSSERSPKKIVIRLFESRWHCGNFEQKGSQIRTESRTGQLIAPYLMIVRSGSGWVQAREYFDKYHFKHRTDSKKDRVSRYQHSLVANTFTGTRGTVQTRLVVNNPSWRTATQPPAAMAHFVANTQISILAANVANEVASNVTFVGIPPSTLDSLLGNGPFLGHRNRVANANANTLPKRPGNNASMSVHSEHAMSTSHAKDTVMISPRFRPFLKLPQELQDEILFQAVGYTRIVTLTRTAPLKRSSPLPEAPITITNLFQISKKINQHMIPHIYRSTNFHFGATGFTKFLWQLGPTNRSDLQHLTFHFGKASLLHCIRWLAPDPIWELFEPPVATNPPTLTQFWRCQIQDLMRELNLSTMTIDIEGVPPEDVPMLVRILKAAIGSIERICVIDEHSDTYVFTDEYARALQEPSSDRHESTWREMCLQYHRNYKHQRWYMRSMWAAHNEDIQPLLGAWMDTDKTFFDS